MKASKAGFIVTLIFAIIFAVIGAVIMFLPKPYCPVSIENEFGMRKGHGVVYLTGSLRNTSEDPVTITYLDVKGSTTDSTFDGPGHVNFVIEPGEVFDIGQEEYYISSYGQPKSISKVKIEIDGVSYTIYGSDTAILSAALFVFAGIMLLVSIVSLVGSNRQQKRYNSIVDELSKMQCHAVFSTGLYGKKGDRGKAAAKTAASVAGGMLFGAIFGIGFFKIYGANNARELILTDGGLYCGPLKTGRAATYGLDLASMTFIPKAAFANSEVYIKNKQVTIRNINTTEFFTFNLAGNTQVTPEQLEAQLLQLATPSPVEDTIPPVDPFGGEAAATYGATAQSTNAEPEKSDGATKDDGAESGNGGAPKGGNNPFDEIG